MFLNNNLLINCLFMTMYNNLIMLNFKHNLLTMNRFITLYSIIILINQYMIYYNNLYLINNMLYNDYLLL